MVHKWIILVHKRYQLAPGQAHPFRPDLAPDRASFYLHPPQADALKDACVRLSTRGHMDTNFVQLPGGRQRGPHEFQASVIEACLQPGVSIAAMALASGLMQ